MFLADPTHKTVCPIDSLYRDPHGQVFVSGVVGRMGGKPQQSIVPEETLPRHDLAEVGNAREPAQHLVDQPQMRPANHRIGIEHHHLVEECIHHWA